MTKFTIALREIGTYKEVLRSQVSFVFILFQGSFMKSLSLLEWFLYVFVAIHFTLLNILLQVLYIHNCYV